uniref:FAS1 domain-containing protein n=1 Tax=Skeletonema marinoi TaxID=267567 RepID=A0A7S2KMV3_9STRA|mmetsp:Transcript_14296/g.23919  ORF Transcript_14296/g.23919 Transcript_14296/m.23919 type:complete len:263 (+) Transcript_14296:77-865(+)
MLKYYSLLCLALLVSVAAASSTDQKKAIINLRQLQQGATRPPKTPPPTAPATRPPKTPPPIPVATRPPKTPAPTEAVPETPSPTIAGPQSIAQIVCSNNDFFTLCSYLEITGLYGKLNSSGTSTLFAPNNDAFEKLANVVDLTDDEIMGLLMYHVAPNILTYNNLMMIAPGVVETMVPALPIAVSTGADGDVLLNGNVKITTPDIEASNGIIQVIDQVIIPPINPPTRPAPVTPEPTLMGKSSKHSSKSSKYSSMSNMSYKV